MKQYGGFACLFLFLACRGGESEKKITQSSGPVINSIGRQLPPDAAPLEEQIMMYFIEEPKNLDVSMDNYGVKGADPWLFERLTMFDENDVLGPAAADRWCAAARCRPAAAMPARPFRPLPWRRARRLVLPSISQE